MELQPSDEVRDTMQTEIARINESLMSPQASALPMVMRDGRTIAGPKMMINGAVYRRLAMISTDVYNIELTKPTMRLMRRIRDLRGSTALPEAQLGLTADEFVWSQEVPDFQDPDPFSDGKPKEDAGKAFDLDEDNLPERTRRAAACTTGNKTRIGV